jgi:hypothetical protein
VLERTAGLAGAHHHDPDDAHPGESLMIERLKTQDDPVVSEVRQARQELWRRAGGTLGGMIRLLDEMTGVTAKRKSTKGKRRGRTRRMKSPKL